MMHVDEVNKQLRRIGADFHFWNRPEVRELPKILFENERLEHAVSGRYEGGFALLCATSQRVLLIDKKPFYLTLEDMRYDMISDVQYNHRLIDTTVKLNAVNKSLAFTSYNPAKLRHFTNYVQEQVMRTRQQHDPLAAQFYEATPSKQGTLKLEPVAPAPMVNPYRSPVMIRRRVSRFY